MQNDLEPGKGALHKDFMPEKPLANVACADFGNVMRKQDGRTTCLFACSPNEIASPTGIRQWCILPIPYGVEQSFPSLEKIL